MDEKTTFIIIEKMKKYIKNYMEAYGFYSREEIYCQVCGAIASDIHHIIFKSQIFGKNRDAPENLIALCRVCHEKAHNLRTPFLKVEKLQEIVKSDLENII